jgi:signal transduction histidine kinase
MRERAEIMGATLTIQSRPRRGTEVRVVLPLTATRPTNDTASM